MGGRKTPLNGTRVAVTRVTRWGVVGQMSAVPGRRAPGRQAQQAQPARLIDSPQPEPNPNDIALSHRGVRLARSRVNVAYRDRETPVTSALKLPAETSGLDGPLWTETP